MSTTTKRILIIIAAVVVVGALVAVAVIFAPTLLDIVSDPEQFRQWVEENGVASSLAMIGMMILKAVIPVIPGKPFEIGAGYAFGAVEGTLLCIIGTTLGSYIVFFIVRTVGAKALSVFYPREKLLSLRFLKDSKRLAVWVFFIMLIPGTPKDFISYFVGLTDIKFRVWAIISPLARIPVTIMATVGGDALGSQNYGFAIGVIVVSLLISAVGLFVYNRISKKKS